MCHPRHPIYLIFSSLRVMPRVHTTLHFSVAHDEDIIRQLANCDENYKFFVYPYSMLHKFVIVSEVIVTNYSEIVRMLHA